MNVHLDAIPCSFCDRRAVLTVVVAAPTPWSREVQHRRTSASERGLPVVEERTAHVEDHCLAHLSGHLSADRRREAEASRRARGAA